MSRRMNKKELDAQFQAFLNASVSSEESIDKFLTPPPKNQAPLQPGVITKRWWMDDDSIDDSFHTGAKSFLKSKTPVPQHSTPIDGSTGGGQEKTRSHIDPEKRDACIRETRVTKRGDASISHDSLDNISEKSEHADTNGDLPKTNADSPSLDSKGFTMTGRTTLKEEEDKERFFQELEKNGGMVDYGRLNQEMSQTMSLRVMVDSHSPHDRSDNGHHKQTNLLSKVSLLDSQENTPSSQRGRDQDAGVGPQDTLNMIGTGFLWSNTSQEMAALQRAYKDIQSSPPLAEHEPSGLHHDTSNNPSLLHPDVTKNSSHDARNRDHNTNNNNKDSKTGGGNPPNITNYSGDNILGSAHIPTNGSSNPSNERSTLNSQLQKVVITGDRGEAFDLQEAGRARVNVDDLKDETDRREESIVNLLNAASPETQRGDVGNTRTVEDILREVEQMELRARQAAESRVEDIVLTSDLRSPASVKSPVVVEPGRVDQTAHDKHDKQNSEKHVKENGVRGGGSVKQHGISSRSPSRGGHAKVPSQKPIVQKQPKALPPANKTVIKSNIPRRNVPTETGPQGDRKVTKGGNKQGAAKSGGMRSPGKKPTAAKVRSQSPRKTQATKGVWSPAGHRVKETESDQKQTTNDDNVEKSVESFAGHMKERCGTETGDLCVRGACDEVKRGIEREPSRPNNNPVSMEMIHDLRGQLAEEKKNFEKLKESYIEKQKQYEDDIKTVRTSHEEEVYRLRQDNFILTAKIKESLSSVGTSDDIDEVTRCKLERLEKDVKEQEVLLEGYASENKRLYDERKRAEKRSKIVEEEMAKENQRLLMELSTVRTKLERKEEELFHRGVITGADMPKEIASGTALQPTAEADVTRLADLEIQLGKAKKSCASLEREMSVLRKSKADVDDHVERLIREREDLHKKITGMESLSEQVEEYKSEAARLGQKVAWYVENQRLLDRDAATLRGKDDKIATLTTRLAQLQTESGQKLQENKTWRKDKSQYTKKIADLERQVKEMEQILKRRHPNSLAALMMTAAALPEPSNEKTASEAVLHERIGKLETELANKDEELNKQLRAVEQKYNSLKHQYEGQIAHLEDKLSGRIADPHHPHTHGQALSRELESVRARHHEEVESLRADVTRLNRLLQNHSNSQGMSLEEYERCRVENLEKDSRIRVLELQLANKDLPVVNQKQNIREKDVLTMANSESLTALTAENQRLHLTVDSLQLELDQQRVSLNKALAEHEAELRKTKELYEAKLEEARSCHQNETYRLLTQHLSKNTGSKVTELQCKLDTQEVMMKHLKEQLSEHRAVADELTAAKSRESALQTELAAVKEEVFEARSHHSPAMRQFEALREKIMRLEQRHLEREREIREAVANTRRAVREEMAGEILVWERVVREKNEEIARFRSELDAVLEVLNVLKQQGVVLTTA